MLNPCLGTTEVVDLQLRCNTESLGDTVGEMAGGATVSFLRDSEEQGSTNNI